MARSAEAIRQEAMSRLTGMPVDEDEDEYRPRRRFDDDDEDDEVIDYTSPQATSSRVRSIRPTHMYYRQPDGWITSGRASRIERSQFEDEGWVPLTAYGLFDMAHLWSANNPHATLFQFGGAKELPVAQILALGYHFNPPLVPACGKPQTEKHNHDSDCYLGARKVVFPQLRNVNLEDLGPFACGYCERTDIPTAKALEQHQSVAHQEERGNVRTGVSLADHLTAGLLKGLKGFNAGTLNVVEDGEEAEPEEVEDLVAQGANAVLSVLNDVGLNKKQIAALQAAGLIDGFDEPATDDTNPQTEAPYPMTLPASADNPEGSD